MNLDPFGILRGYLGESASGLLIAVCGAWCRACRGGLTESTEHASDVPK